jgi:hypothetical protein
MTWHSWRPFLLSALVLPGAALAQRISVLDFRGPGGAAVRASLVPRLCDTADCVAANKVVSAGKPDGKKARRELLQYLVQGVVTRARGKVPASVDLTVLAVERGVLAVKTHRAFALDARGKLAPRTLPGAVEFLKASFVEAPVELPKAAPPPPLASPTPQPEPAPVATRLPEPVSPEVAPVEVAPRPVRKPLVLAVELGADVTVRSLTYAGLTTNNLRDYQPFFFAAPQVRVEFYPLALFRADLLAGLGLDAAFAYAPYLRTKRTTSATDAFPTSSSRLDVSLRWRLLPIPTYALAIIPYAGWRLQRFVVGGLADGTRLDGLPGISFSGLRAGVALEVPVIPDFLIVLLRGGVLPMFSAGEIISPSYFPAGSTLGFEASGGVAVQLAPWLQVRATFEFSQYQLSFTTTPADRYVATGALERSLGGNVSARLQF